MRHTRAVELTDGVVRLRAPQLSDGPAVAAAVGRALESLAPWMPWATPDYDTTSARTWIRLEGEHAHPFLILGDDGDIAGSVGINQVDPANLRANLGYWLAPAYTGRGWATRATRLAARHGFAAAGLHRLEIAMSVENSPSRAVAERAGARFEGIARGYLHLHGRFHDARLYSLLPTDLPPPDLP